MTGLYLLFFQSSIATFTNFDKFLQREEPLIYSIYDHMQTFMNKLASKFIKPNVIQELKNAKKSFTKLDILLECQKDNNNLFIGFITKQTLKKLLEDKISPREADRFFGSVCAFYKAAYEYCTMVTFIDFSFDDVQSIMSAFPLLNQDILNNVHKLDELGRRIPCLSSHIWE